MVGVLDHYFGMKLTAELIKVSRYCLHQELSFDTQHEYVQNYEFENFNNQQFYLPTADGDPASYSMKLTLHKTKKITTD